jgi:hypothetical protein
MDKLIDGLLQSGAVGAVLAIMLWVNYKIGTKLISVIETNTQALTQAKDALNTSSMVIEKNSTRLIDLTRVQPQRRDEFGRAGT